MMIPYSKNSLSNIVEVFEDEPMDEQSMVENDSSSAGSNSTATHNDNYIDQILEQLVLEEDIDEQHCESKSEKTKSNSRSGTEKNSVVFPSKSYAIAPQKVKFEHEIVFAKTKNGHTTLISDDDSDSTTELIKTIAYERGYLCDDPPTIPPLEIDNEVPSFDAVVTSVDDDGGQLDNSQASNKFVGCFDLCYLKFVNYYKVFCIVFTFLLISVLLSFIFVQGFRSGTGEEIENPTTHNIQHHQNTKLTDILTLFGFQPQAGTPQFMAIEFLANEDTDNHIPSKDIQDLVQEFKHKRNTKVSSDVFERLVQRYAVLTIYFSMSSYEKWDGFNKMMQVRLHECNWPGIMCNGAGRNVVTDIKTNKNIGQLRGNIPTEIGLLSDLETLLLSNNRIYGELPSEIFGLSKLYALSLSGNKLSSTINPLIAQLTNLRFLDLSNSVTLGTIPTEIGLLTSLRFLRLARNNQLNGTIPTEIGKLSFLEQATFYETNLVGSVPFAMCHNVPKLYLIANSCTNINDTLKLSCQCCRHCFSLEP